MVEIEGRVSQLGGKGVDFVFYTDKWLPMLINNDKFVRYYFIFIFFSKLNIDTLL